MKVSNNVRIMYLRKSPKFDEVRGEPVSCVAISVGDGSASYRTATHHPADRFDRHLAQKIAIERLDVAGGKRVSGKFESMHDVSKAIMVSISEDHDEPARARKAAKLWLKENA